MRKLDLRVDMTVLDPEVLHDSHLEAERRETRLAKATSFHMNMAPSPTHKVRVEVAGFHERPAPATTTAVVGAFQLT